MQIFACPEAVGKCVFGWRSIYKAVLCCTIFHSFHLRAGWFDLWGFHLFHVQTTVAFSQPFCGSNLFQCTGPSHRQAEDGQAAGWDRARTGRACTRSTRSARLGRGANSIGLRQDRHPLPSLPFIFGYMQSSTASIDLAPCC